MDAVQKANSGHPGTPMALAPLAHVLFTRIMKYDAGAPDWPDRDRFVLSNGHASMLLYSLLYLTGFGLTLDDLERVPAVGLEDRRPPRVRATRPASRSPPVRSARASPTASASASPRRTSARASASEVVDHHMFVFCGDGDLEEGVSHEAASLAGHLGLGRLVYVYDDNHITIDGPTELSYSDDVPERFEGYGWHVVELGEVANDLDALEAGLREGMAEAERPSLVMLRSHIGWPSPKYTDTAHGARQPARRRRGRRGQGDPRAARDEDFYVPDDVLEYYREAGRRGACRPRERGSSAASRSRDREPGSPTSSTRASSSAGSPGGRRSCPSWNAGDELATRAGVRARSLDAIARRRARARRAAAPTSPATPARSSRTRRSIATHHFGGRQLHFGIREHGMGSIMNGMAVSGLAARRRHVLRVQRLHARRGAPRRAVAVQDRVRLDPRLRRRSARTARPTSRSSSSRRMRAMPGLRVIRPADANETAQAWRIHIDGDGPDRARSSPARSSRCSRAPPSARPRACPRGAYVLVDETGDGLDLVLIGTGSEVSVCVGAPRAARRRRALGAGGVDAVVGPVRARSPTTTASRCSRPACRRSRSRPAPASAGSATPTTPSASTTSARRRPAPIVHGGVRVHPRERRRARPSRCSRTGAATR